MSVDAGGGRRRRCCPPRGGPADGRRATPPERQRRHDPPDDTLGRFLRPSVFIGWFLRNAATAEGRYGALQRDLVDVRVRDIMTPSGPLIGDWMSVGALIDGYAIEENKPTYLLAGTDGRAMGVVTLRDLAEVPVSERYTTSVRTVARSLDQLPAVSVQQPAAELLGKIGSPPLAVVWDGSLPVGTVTVSQFGEAAETARLLARLRGAQQPAA